uniref:Very long-chain fatty acid transport protein n=1 Tax=Globisporangium ultimum (strain ATCC 200006 / CBS 805.95 / DAOM BR144) TaxID=431595 RepID=K3WW31_GLOUD
MATSAQELLDKLPSKFLTVAGVAALGYYVDQKLLLTSDLKKSGWLGYGLIQTRRYTRNHVLVPDLFEQSVRKWPHKACMQFEDRSLTFTECDAIANRVAHWALQRGLRVGQTVALLMENRPEFVLVWLGLAKVGVITALINTHLQADGLVHCVKLADTQELIVGAELVDKLAQVEARLPGTSFHMYSDVAMSTPPSLASYPFVQSFDAELAPMSSVQPPASIRKDAGLKTTDMALLIYTSGTTGLPKAARVSHFSIILRALMFHYSMHLNVFDRIYCALPLYHTSGGNLSVGMMIFSGATLCISRRFSTSKFWEEVRQFDCTVVQYIGEMCRYLMNAPPKDNDKQNHVRAAFGNGLRPDVWAPYQERFGIPTVYEFYGSTEGILGMLNSCTSPEDQGHLGRRGFILNTVSGTKIVRYDVDSDKHVRTKAGFMQECGTNEVGELICLVDNSNPSKQFHGYYNNEEESNKKILRDVFKKGDMYFRTGDLFKIDERSCWHFMDRVGDTFRWKGENVATNEVSEAISVFPGLSDICIYGVEVPGNEGRACLAAMVFDEATFDMSAFVQHVKKRLPSYAMPIFIRQLGEMSVTGTMKHEKAKLRKEGVDPSKIQDRLWYFNKASDAYERLTSENYHKSPLSTFDFCGHFQFHL